MIPRCSRPVALAFILLFVALVAASILYQIAPSQRNRASEEDDFSTLAPRRLEVGVVNSDEFAESILMVKPAETSIKFDTEEHAKLTSILAKTRELVETSRSLLSNSDTQSQEQGKEMMDLAMEMFTEVKDHVSKLNMMLRAEAEKRSLANEEGSAVEAPVMGVEERGRTMDVSRKMFQMAVTFPECVERFLNHCIATINRDLRKLGLDTIEMVVHEKRSLLPDQDGYNKVVIVTNDLADRVVGRLGDGMVTYPYMWNDSKAGLRTLGVDGKWNCLGLTPDQCCSQITESCPNEDKRGNHIACHIFVPYSIDGVKKKRDDRVIINLSTDGRVHEAPVIG